MITYCCMYHQNDVRYIPGMLDSLPQGSVVVLMQTIPSMSTGSELVETKQENGLTIKLVTYKYSDWSYSAGRNELQKYVDTEWIFMVDADERVSIELQDYENIKKYPKRVGGCNVAIVSGVKNSENGHETTVSKVVRLYRNDNFVWINTCHEQIIYAIVNAGYDIIDTSILIRHHGYSLRPQELLYKYERNIQLMSKDVGNKDLPNDANADGLKNKLMQTLQQYFLIKNNGAK